MGYLGARDLAALHDRAKFVQQSAAGARESHVHDMDVVHEAPNYSIPDSD
jgi:IMP dehydrogenase